MKQNNFLKALLIIVAVLLVGFIIYNSYQATEVKDLVKNPIPAYSFSPYMDSVCQQIRSSNVNVALDMYTSLYQDINVLGKIQTTAGMLISADSLNRLYQQCFNAVWPSYNESAENLFSQHTWSHQRLAIISKGYKKFRVSNNYRQGVSHTDKLDKYSKYVSGYNTIIKYLKIADSCSSRSDYEAVLMLDSYRSTPYSNLTELQGKIGTAKERAKDHWKSVLEKEAQSLLAQQIDFNSLEIFKNKYSEWFNRQNDFKVQFPLEETDFGNYEMRLRDKISLFYQQSSNN